MKQPCYTEVCREAAEDIRILNDGWMIDRIGGGEAGDSCRYHGYFYMMKKFLILVIWRTTRKLTGNRLVPSILLEYTEYGY
ncbi:MAG: hypothetical protein R3B93_27650 [Bacteroidia bacterium]